MKKIFFALIALTTICNITAVAQSWQWVSSGQANYFDQVEWITVDKCGNTYVTGSFYNTLTIDTFQLVSNGYKDVFWVKYNKHGQVIWAKSTGGNNDDDPGGIAVDNAGNVYVFLSFSDTISNGGFQAFNSGYRNDLLLAKYDSSGNLLTYKTWGTPYAEIATSIAINKNNQLIIYGSFNGYNGVVPPPVAARMLVLDSNHILQSYSNYGQDIFIVKLDTSLTILFSKSAEGNTGTNKILADYNGNNFITGTSAYKMKFDAILLTAPYIFVWIAKYDSTGNALWANMGTSNFMGTYGILCSTSPKGNVYCVGQYDTPPNISPYSQITFGNTTLTGDYAFMVKYDPAGNLKWAKNVGKTARDAAYDVAVDAHDNIYVTGTFNYMGVFGSDTFYTVGHNDLFVNKYDSNGNHIWTTTAGGISNDGGYAIILDKNQNILVGGYIASTPAYFGNHQVSSAGNWDMCVAKLSPWTTDIEQPKEIDKFISIYPNPNSGSFQVELKKGKYQLLTITDVNGKVIYRQQLSQAQSRLNINIALSNGMYFIRLTNAKESVIQKFIVPH
ncbi:MAG TPA: T9SS type A sorting domain-containing protein [Flavipsychrobacter sp.]|nr:T9SS type A sorting domain-containing protein [Flavipsychrobacter sp.]